MQIKYILLIYFEQHFIFYFVLLVEHAGLLSALREFGKTVQLQTFAIIGKHGIYTIILIFQ